jgi:hypothetical protein
MGSNKQGQNLDFVGMSTGGFNMRVRKDGMEVEPQHAIPERAKAVVPVETSKEEMAERIEIERMSAKARAEDEQRLKERIREELKAEVMDEVRAEMAIEAEARAEVEAEMNEKQEEPKELGLAKASPAFEQVDPKATASEDDLDEAIENNTKEVD